MASATTGLTTEQVTINDALQIQQDLKNEVRAQNYQGAEGAGAPDINGPMTPEANAAAGASIGTVEATTIGAGIAAGGIPLGGIAGLGNLASGDTLVNANNAYLWDSAYVLFDELFALRKQEDEASGDELVAIQNRITEIHQDLENIAQALNVEVGDLARYYYERRAAERRIARTYRHFLDITGNPSTAWLLTDHAIRNYSPNTYRSAFEAPQIKSALPEETQKSIDVAQEDIQFDSNNVSKSTLDGIDGAVKTEFTSPGGHGYVIVDTGFKKVLFKRKDPTRVDQTLYLAPGVDSGIPIWSKWQEQDGYEVVGMFPATVGDQAIIDTVLGAKDLRFKQALYTGLNASHQFLLDLLPGHATWRYAKEGNILEAVISGVGDLTLVGGALAKTFASSVVSHSERHLSSAALARLTLARI